MKTSTLTYRNERSILRATILALLDAGYTVRMDDGEGQSAPLTSARAGVDFVTWNDDVGGRVLWNLDQFSVLASKEGRPASWVWFIVSNGNDGRDVISDYGDSLDFILKPILDRLE